MTLNLRIKRNRPRRRSRRRVLGLLLAIVAASAWLAWLRGWPPPAVWAKLSQDVMANAPAEIRQLPLAALPLTPDSAPEPPAEAVVMVSSQVVDNPGSEAYTANLYVSTGKDEIPWPNIDGRSKVLVYEVKSGDSLWGIAHQFGLDIDSLRWANPDLERNPDVLAVGTQLRILPVPGVYHVAVAGETIEQIAELYGVAPEDIADYPPNGLFPPYELEDGQGLIIPYGRKGVVLPPPAPSWGAQLAWPIAGAVSGGFGADHPALDIGAPYGSTVYAADGGTITYAGWATDGYGYTVVVDHGNGLETWYNHLKGALLPAGNYIERGTPIGEVGSTGHSSGPHVHFEVRVEGQQVNPYSYLPGDTPQ